MKLHLDILVIADAYTTIAALGPRLLPSDCTWHYHAVQDRVQLQAALAAPLSWQLVLSGYDLPDCMFAEVLAQLHQLQPALPVILIAGRIGEDTVVELLHAGLTDYVPVNAPERLPAVIARHLTQLTDGACSTIPRLPPPARHPENRRRYLPASIPSTANLNTALCSVLGAVVAPALLAAVFSRTQTGMVVTDIAGKVVAINPAFVAASGYTEPELLGQNLNLLRSDRHSSQFYQDMWHSLRTGGNWEGEIWNRHKNGDAYAQWLVIAPVWDGVGEVTHYVGVYLDLEQDPHRQTQREYLHWHDALTGLPNHQLFLSCVHEALQRSAIAAAVLFIDLDHFKQINEKLGHLAGDELLQLIGQRLRDRLRASDTLARVGGDEFAILLEGINASTDAAQVAENITHRLGSPLCLGCGYPVSLTVNVTMHLLPEATTAVLTRLWTVSGEVGQRRNRLDRRETGCRNPPASARCGRPPYA